MLDGPILYELVCVDIMLSGSYYVSYKGLKRWGFWPITLEWFELQRSSFAASTYYGFAFLHKTDLRKTA